MVRQIPGDDPRDFGVPADAPRSRDDFRRNIDAGKDGKKTPNEAWETQRGTEEPRFPFRRKNKASKVGKGKRGKRGGKG